MNKIKTILVSLIILITLSCKTESPGTKPLSVDSASAKNISSEKIIRDSIPQPAGFVNDYEKVFTPSQKDSLETMIKEFEKETTIQIAVITLDSTMTTAATLDETTLQMARAWGVGQKIKTMV